MKTSWTRIHVVIAIMFCVLGTNANAQDMEQGAVEATGQVGFVAGIGTHSSFGGSIGTAVRERIFVLGEFTYIPLGGGEVEGFGFRTGGSARIYNFNFGGHYLFDRSDKTAPYVGGGIAILHSRVSGSSSFGGTSASVSASGTDAYLSLGGGLRYYHTDRWGFKPELMLFFGPESFVRLGGGIFYQFGRD